jgi:hypothetical protein
MFAIAAALAGCEPGDLKWIPAGGGSGYAPAPPAGTVARPPAPAVRPSATPFAPDVYAMMENPDAEINTSAEEVWATSEEEAQAKCQRLAQRMTKEGGTLVTVQGKPQKVTVRPSKHGNYKYVCQLRSEAS